MIHEKSCGVVLFYAGNKDSLEVLLLHYPEGHWEFPKGHVEEGEDELQTALRELEEETGVNEVEVVDGFKEKMHYFFTKKGEKISKEVEFFMGVVKHKNITLSYEHQNFIWMPYKDALERVTFDNAKEILKKAKQFLD